MEISTVVDNVLLAFVCIMALWAVPVVLWMMYQTMKMVIEDITDEIKSYKARKRMMRQ